MRYTRAPRTGTDETWKGRGAHLTPAGCLLRQQTPICVPRLSEQGQGDWQDGRVERGSWDQGQQDHRCHAPPGSHCLTDGYIESLQNAPETGLPAKVEWSSRWLFSLKTSVKLNTIVKGNRFEALEINQRKKTNWEAFIHANLLELLGKNRRSLGFLPRALPIPNSPHSLKN